MDQFLDIYNIIFLVLALAIILRLRSVLGRKTGSERPPFDPYANRDRAEPPPPPRGTDDNVIVMPRPGMPAPPPVPGDPVDPAKESPLDRALRTILSADRTFDRENFLRGARMAYEMIVTAFAMGDRKQLKGLLSREVYEGFVAAIDEREKRGEKVETTFVGIDKADIVEAALKGQQAQLTVRFLCHLITVTRDRAGAVIDGDPSKVSELVDVWTFERNVASNDPTWLLVATKSPD
jgi:predicted lipid-binding transport protein (Tim44 family)